ncbi:hypothetical protein SDRG_08974 [Saprolegnia diclina VS20]|uniref:RING-type domain-containing protein n=1 Tax=Saprolegnia diclina (strain VS20) TaxID=1156394 RepID=T0RME5_SAPDV|nr:hypothetical protein SDRG_08974 [Saprolegnia diclina VS20]EQC33463.1 hypothetical protein SDRG_08974 [Saprolegnia diclina VS20]|eukprot:XP_008613103.1 hypothetical protein SDRG_08974 [Saprolegnia diclina VS20]
MRPLTKPLTLVSIRSSAKQTLSQAYGHLVTYYSLTVMCPNSHVWWSMKRRYSDLYYVRTQLQRMYKHALKLKGARQTDRVVALLAPVVSAKFPPKRLGLDTTNIVQERLIGLKEFVAHLMQLRSSCLELRDPSNDSYFETEQLNEIYRLLGHALAVPTRMNCRPTTTTVATTEPCAICLEDHRDGAKDSVFQLPCGHEFHQECILEWFETQHTCPMCRTEAFAGYIV